MAPQVTVAANSDENRAKPDESTSGCPRRKQVGDMLRMLLGTLLICGSILKLLPTRIFGVRNEHAPTADCSGIVCGVITVFAAYFAGETFEKNWANGFGLILDASIAISSCVCAFVNGALLFGPILNGNFLEITETGVVFGLAILNAAPGLLRVAWLSIKSTPLFVVKLFEAFCFFRDVQIQSKEAFRKMIAFWMPVIIAVLGVVQMNVGTVLLALNILDPGPSISAIIAGFFCILAAIFGIKIHHAQAYRLDHVYFVSLFVAIVCLLATTICNSNSRPGSDPDSSYSFQDYDGPTKIYICTVLSQFSAAASGFCLITCCLAATQTFCESRISTHSALVGNNGTAFERLGEEPQCATERSQEQPETFTPIATILPHCINSPRTNDTQELILDARSPPESHPAALPAFDSVVSSRARNDDWI